MYLRTKSIASGTAHVRNLQPDPVAAARHRLPAGGIGLHGLLLPLRGQAEGFSTAALGLLGTAWAGGFVDRLLLRAAAGAPGRPCRAFGAFAASGAIIALMTGLMIDEYVWIVLRAVTGFTMAGAFMVIESWLNEKATNENRGTVFGLYMMVTYASIMAGQMIVAAGDVTHGVAVHGGRHLLLLLADPDRGLDRGDAQAAGERLARPQGALRQFAGRRSSAACWSASPTAPGARSARSTARASASRPPRSR